ncbi:MAG: RNA polymerase sigma factor [Sphingobacteriales bacterium]|nr:MAG: RNA polymerase sigma factor [Sphingobacteriales bacterium]
MSKLPYPSKILKTGENQLSEIRTLPDKDLVALIIDSGDTSLFGELYDRYANKVYRKCISMVKNTEDAQDLAHEVLVKAFLNISKFAGNSSFSTWVYAITYNQCIDFIRSKQKIKLSDADNERLPDLTDERDSELVDKELFEIEINLLMQLLQLLNPDDRAILLMKYQDDMSIEDIQTVLNLNSSAVKMRLKRARDRLRIFYQKHQ